jgi:hypothetical protein
LREPLQLVKRSRQWVEAASPEDLVQGVAAAAFGAYPYLKWYLSLDFESVGTEERWRRVGMMAPVSAQLFPVMKAFIEAAAPELLERASSLAEKVLVRHGVIDSPQQPKA